MNCTWREIRPHVLAEVHLKISQMQLNAFFQLFQYGASSDTLFHEYVLLLQS